MQSLQLLVRRKLSKERVFVHLDFHRRFLLIVLVPRVHLLDIEVHFLVGHMFTGIGFVVWLDDHSLVFLDHSSLAFLAHLDDDYSLAFLAHLDASPPTLAAPFLTSFSRRLLFFLNDAGAGRLGPENVWRESNSVRLVLVGLVFHGKVGVR